MVAKAVLVVIGSWWARWLSGGPAGGLARRLRGGSGAHSCQIADLTKVVVVEQCYGGSGRTGIRGTDGPLFAMRGGEAGEMARERNECAGLGFARLQLEMLGSKSFLLNSRGGAVGWVPVRLGGIRYLSSGCGCEKIHPC